MVYNKNLQTLKIRSARFVRRDYPEEVAKFYRKNYFWNNGYFISTVSENTLSNVEIERGDLHKAPGNEKQKQNLCLSFRDAFTTEYMDSYGVILCSYIWCTLLSFNREKSDK